MEVKKRTKPPGSGKKKGSKNKATIERERLAMQAHVEATERERLTSTAQVLDPVAAVQAHRAGTLKLGKTILSEFANVLAGMAAYYQPDPSGANTKADEGRFRVYAELALYAADKVAPFESPRLSAVAIGQTQITLVKVEGGMPDEFSAPAENAPKLPPLTIISAEDDEPKNVGSTAA